MAYTDRLRQLRYTAPDGQTFTLQFDSLSRSGGKKAPVTEIPGRDDSIVQDLGEETPRFPVDCYIPGPDYDREADRFWKALAQPGYGELEHPRWGNLTVIPVSREQTEQFVSDTGRASFRVEFVQINQEQVEFPRATTDASAETTASVDAIEQSVAANVGDITVDVREQATLKEQVLGTMSDISNAFRNAANEVDGLTADIDEQVNEITREIDTLVKSPASLFSSVLRLYRTPAEVGARVTTKLEGYRNLYNGLAEDFAETTRKYGSALGLMNAAQLAGLSGAAAEATQSGDLDTRTSAINAVEMLTTLDYDLHASIEDIEVIGAFQSPYEVQAATSRAVSGAVGNLIDRALSLPTERVEVLDRSITPVQWVWEIDGDLSRLDTLMRYNEFQGNEIMLIPAGREVRWYG
jgi:prophage DNA circulation protein